MRMSKLFTKTSKQAPANEVSLNAQLLIRAGFVYKVMAGVYAYTPLGLKVIENIKQLIREELNGIDGQEILMSSLQNKEIWLETGRWSDEIVDIWFKSQLKDGTEVGLGWTHEEPIIAMMRTFIKSYKDLPVSVYQFQTKLRNELRAKSGIMRGREFIMNDMYSMHATEQQLKEYYDKVISAYKRCYDKLGIGKDTFVTFASGGAFTKFSHEFQTICDAGEDFIYINREKNIAINEEIVDEAIQELGINRDELEKVKTAEVGNIFNFGIKKSEEMKLVFTDKTGKEEYIYMGSYGIGVTRVMGVIVEKFADEKGMVWPSVVAPALINLVSIGEAGTEVADKLYDELARQSVSVLYDDRNERAGAKFSDADLMGLPWRVTISDRAVNEGLFELTERSSGETQKLNYEELLNKVQELK